jgi:hypothetical protein
LLWMNDPWDMVSSIVPSITNNQQQQQHHQFQQSTVAIRYASSSIPMVSVILPSPHSLPEQTAASPSDPFPLFLRCCCSASFHPFPFP